MCVQENYFVSHRSSEVIIRCLKFLYFGGRLWCPLTPFCFSPEVGLPVAVVNEAQAQVAIFCRLLNLARCRVVLFVLNSHEPRT